MTPAAAIVAAWLVWLVTWILAAGWSARTAAHHDLGAVSPSRVLTFGAIVMFVMSYWPAQWAVVWIASDIAAWSAFAFALAGFMFAWAARLHLGPLWSMTAAPTEEHRIVDTGPYGIVRHPVYAGLLLSAWATALQLGRIEALAGALVLTAALSLRAKLEERFLRADLGDAAYSAYRARVPMLIPFLRRAPASGAASGGG